MDNRLLHIGNFKCATEPCGCTPPVDTVVEAQITSDGVVNVVIPKNGDVTELAKIEGPEWLTYEVTQNEYVFNGQSDGAAHCATFRALSECGEAIWVIKIPAKCVAPSAVAPTITLDENGQTTTSVTFNTPVVLESVTGLDGAAVNVVGKTLTIVGSPPAGQYNIVVSNECGRYTLTGEVVAPPPVPPCEQIRVGAPSGTFSVIVGEQANLCFPLTGTPPISLDSVEGLPAGLTAVINTSSTGSQQLCITGTVVEDLCAGAAGCRQGKVVLSNCAGQIEVVPKIYIKDPPAPRPPFCVGMIFYDGGGAFRAEYFPPGSTLYVDVVHTNNPSSPPVVTTTEITLGSQGEAEFTVPDPAGAGCPAPIYHVYFRHPTCAIAVNRVLVETYYGTDNCSPGP